MNFRTNMTSLRNLSEAYYQNRLSFSEYREKRSHLLKLIDEDLNGVKYKNDKEVLNENLNESLVDKALSFLKIAK